MNRTCRKLFNYYDASKQKKKEKKKKKPLRLQRSVLTEHELQNALFPFRNKQNIRHVR